MKILMLAPEPFFQPRGTPISVYFRIKALTDLGHKVDLVTYHLGEDKFIKGLKIIRIPNFFFIKKVKIGPSLTKIPLDFLLFFTAHWQLIRRRYDLIFSHEEAALLGVVLARIQRLPHVYDMHSSLPQQLENFNFSHSQFLKNLFIRMERFILKNSQAVLVICLDLMNKVRKEGFEEKITLLENFIDFDHPEYAQGEIKRKRKEYAPNEEKIVLYTGNLQPYQGIPLLLEAAARIKNDRIIFLLVGGGGSALESLKRKARKLNISDKVIFTGQVPPSQIPTFTSMADVLVSPRLTGTNTPLKIYSFLKSGKPIVATNLWTHTQILNDNISVLVNPDAESFAQGISFALNNEEAKARAKEAKRLAEIDYTYPAYRDKMRDTLKKASVLSGKR